MSLGSRIKRSGCLFVFTAAALILVTLFVTVSVVRLVGSSGSVAFPACQLLVTDSGNVAFDLARHIQFAFSPRITPQIWKNSADDRYTPYQIIENHDPTTASILYIRDNVTGQVAA